MIGLVLLLGGCTLATSGLDPDGMDGAVPDGEVRTDTGVCDGSEEICDGDDEDCDMRVDEGFDLQSDAQNCGRCGNVCASDPANGAVACVAGRCELTCDEGFANCNGDDVDGCEADLASPDTCGSCDTRCADPTPLCTGTPPVCSDSCAPNETLCGADCVDTSNDPLNCNDCGSACPDRPNSSPSCTAGSCGIVCDANFADCNGNGDDGCEVDTRTDVENCNGCGMACPARANATRTCVGGSCDFVCDGGFDDCDGMDATGCEADVSSDASNCGSCGTLCPAGPGEVATCSSSVCGTTCAPGLGDCDGMPGCEADFTSRDTCGGCGVECAVYESCGAGGCVNPCRNMCGCGSFPCCEANCPPGMGTSCSFSSSSSCEQVLDCRDRADCTGTCSNAGSCLIDCRRSATCTNQCNNASTCIIDCRGAGSCQSQCSDASSCILYCGTTPCTITNCTGTVRSCMGGTVRTCNVPCSMVPAP